MKLRSYVTWQDFTSAWFLHLSHCELFVQLYSESAIGIFVFFSGAEQFRQQEEALCSSPNNFRVTKSRKMG